MVSRDAQLIVSVLVTIVAGAGYTLISFLGLASIANTNRYFIAAGIAAILFPLLMLLVIWLITRNRAPGIWKGTALGMIFVMLLVGLCDGGVVVMSFVK